MKCEICGKNHESLTCGEYDFSSTENELAVVTTEQIGETMYYVELAKGGGKEEACLILSKKKDIATFVADKLCEYLDEDIRIVERKNYKVESALDFFANQAKPVDRIIYIAHASGKIALEGK